jgi:hypothetical protein
MNKFRMNMKTIYLLSIIAIPLFKIMPVGAEESKQIAHSGTQESHLNALVNRVKDHIGESVTYVSTMGSRYQSVLFYREQRLVGYAILSISDRLKAVPYKPSFTFDNKKNGQEYSIKYDGPIILDLSYNELNGAKSNARIPAGQYVSIVGTQPSKIQMTIHVLDQSNPDRDFFPESHQYTLTKHGVTTSIVVRSKNG